MDIKGGIRDMKEYRYKSEITKEQYEDLARLTDILGNGVTKEEYNTILKIFHDVARRILKEGDKEEDK